MDNKVRNHKVNYSIKDKVVDVVRENGKMNCNVDIQTAMSLAEDAGLDLVEVSPSRMEKNAICKIMDYGKLKYKEAKRKKSHKQVMKEIKFNYHIDDHDLKVKNKKVKNFIDKRYQIKYSMEMRGRERNLIDEAIEKITECLNEFGEVAKWTPIKVNYGGRITRITTVISPI